MKIEQMVELFPEVNGKRFDDLVADIKGHGLMHPIVRHEGQILDGRARLRACKLAKVEPRFIEFESLGLKVTWQDYLWSTNVERRHLTADQRAVLGFEWAKVLKAEARERQLTALRTGEKTGGDGKSNATRREIAKRAFVTTHKVQQVEVVKKHAPQLAAKVASGKMKLRDAAKIASRKVVSIRKPRPMTIPRQSGRSWAGSRPTWKCSPRRWWTGKRFTTRLRRT